VGKLFTKESDAGLQRNKKPSLLREGEFTHQKKTSLDAMIREKKAGETVH